jgi:FlaG/FlaF family flagellin (archaellin)
MRRDPAVSPVMANILMVFITLILVAIIIAMILSMPSLQYSFAPTPAIFIITDIANSDEITGELTLDSRVILLHKGTVSYQNKNLKAQFYRNRALVNANIATMNGHDFISTSHIGVQWMGGMGCEGSMWTPGEMTAIDFTDGTFRQGDSVQVDIIDKSINTVISRHTYRVK